MFSLPDYAKRNGIAESQLQEMIEAELAEAEKRAREAKADDRYERRRIEQKQERDDRRTRQDEARARKEDARHGAEPLHRLFDLAEARERGGGGVWLPGRRGVQNHPAQAGALGDR